MKPRTAILLAGLVIVAVSLGIAFNGFAHGTVKAPLPDKQSRRPWLGVYLQDMTPDLAKKKSLKTEEGAYVTRVERKSPADSAGIRKGDVIVEFNGRQIYDADDLTRTVRKAEVGSKGKVVVVRDGERKELQVTLRKYPRRLLMGGLAPMPFAPRISIFRGTGMQGLGLMDLTPQLGKYFEAPDGKGVLVESVEEGSAAETAGFKAGDVILKIGNTRVEEIRDMREELSEFEEGEKVSVEVLRKGAHMTLSLEIEQVEGTRGYEYFFGNSDPPDINMHFFAPKGNRWFDLRLPDMRPQLDRLRLDLDHMKRNLKRDQIDLQRQIKETFQKARMGTEV